MPMINDIQKALEKHNAGKARIKYHIVDTAASGRWIMCYFNEPLAASIEQQMAKMNLPLRRYGFDMERGMWYMVFDSRGD